MRNLNVVSLVIITLITVSCSSNSKLERRLTALERRVAALESGNTASSTASNAKASLASNPGNKNNLQKAALTFENTEFDFGTINEGEIVNHTFEFTNTLQCFYENLSFPLDLSIIPNHVNVEEILCV